MWLSRGRLAGFSATVIVIGALVAASVYAIRVQSQAREKAAQLTGGDQTRAPHILRRYGCTGCHAIRGVASPGGLVGPDLSDIGKRIYVAGVRPNTPRNLIEWIVDPASVKPQTAMPVTGITEPEARDVAAYLLSLR